MVRKKLKGSFRSNGPAEFAYKAKWVDCTSLIKSLLKFESVVRLFPSDICSNLAETPENMLSGVRRTTLRDRTVPKLKNSVAQMAYY